MSNAPSSGFEGLFRSPEELAKAQARALDYVLREADRPETPKPADDEGKSAKAHPPPAPTPPGNNPATRARFPVKTKTSKAQPSTDSKGKGKSKAKGTTTRCFTCDSADAKLLSCGGCQLVAYCGPKCQSESLIVGIFSPPLTHFPNSQKLTGVVTSQVAKPRRLPRRETQNARPLGRQRLGATGGRREKEGGEARRARRERVATPPRTNSGEPGGGAAGMAHY